MFTREHTSLNEAREISYVFDQAVYDHCMDHKTESFDLEVSPKDGGQLLRLRSHTPDPREGFCRAGCFIQKLAPGFLSASSVVSAGDPVISCIILLTFNCHFVERFLLPSIIAGTTIPYEIIIVYNGVETDLSPFENYTVIRSETGWVSKGYNQGVAAAKGRYIAIFHDDCLVTSPGWHQPMVAALEAGAFAVSTEVVYHPGFDLDYLKGTPLVMTRAGYELMGGHDELFFGGIEDLDFSFRIRARGYSVKKIDMAYRHFRGMSTVILLSGRPGELRELFGYCLIPEHTIADWKATYSRPAAVREMMLAVNRENLAYFEQKSLPSHRPGHPAGEGAAIAARYAAVSSIRFNYGQWVKEKFS